jgi:hypothetical protein
MLGDSDFKEWLNFEFSFSCVDFSVKGFWFKDFERGFFSLSLEFDWIERLKELLRWRLKTSIPGRVD